MLIKNIAVASAFLALAFPVAAQTTTSPSTQAVPTEKLIEQYTDLAGSEKNAKSLVTGLRTGSTITLEPTTQEEKSVSFKPRTEKMGNGNINIALAIAEKSLSGVKDPTNADLQAALMGGEIKTSSGTVKLEGVLQMRADGMGWGQIANELGFKLGEVMRAGKAESGAQAARRADSKPEKVAQRSDRAARPDRAERMDKPERPMKPERPGR